MINNQQISNYIYCYNNNNYINYFNRYYNSKNNKNNTEM